MRKNSASNRISGAWYLGLSKLALSGLILLSESTGISEVRTDL